MLPAIEIRKNDSTSSSTSTPINMRRQIRKQKDDGLEEFLELERDKLKVLRQDQQDCLGANLNL